MPSVLAIVSKAVFEKSAPKGVKLGDVIATDRYTSKHKTFEALEEGGALFLVTVRPPDEQLWLVAILESPVFKGGAWVAKPNATPIANITSAIKKLKFSTGQGIAAKAGALGMSLQTPRVLTDEDEALLRGLAGGKPSKTATKTSATKIKATSKADARPMRLANYRDPLNAKLSPSEKKQLDVLLEQEGFGTVKEARANEEVSFELVDVVDAKDKPIFQLYLWPFGSAQLFEAGTTNTVGGAAQDHFDLEEGTDAQLGQLAAAFKADAEALGVKESLIFAKTVKKKERNPLAGAKPKDKLKLIAKGNEWAMAALQALTTDLWGPKWQPYPKRTLDELDDIAREMVERAADAEECDSLRLYGLPANSPDLLRFAGRTPRGPSDEVVKIKGKPMPLWIAFSRVASGDLDAKPVLDAFQALAPDKALAAWKEMASGDAYDLTDAQPWEMKEVDYIWSKRSIEFHTRLFHLLADANLALGKKGLSSARAMVAKVKEHDGATAPMWSGMLAIARHQPGAKELDALIPRVQEGGGYRQLVPPLLQELLAQLPKDRADAVRAKFTPIQAKFWFRRSHK